MADYINGETAIDKLYKLPCKIDEDGYRWVMSRDVAHMLDDIPAADVVPVEQYRRLLKAARAMHTWIFLNTCDEQKAYDECNLTDEDNALLGYGGQFILTEQQ